MVKILKLLGKNAGNLPGCVLWTLTKHRCVSLFTVDCPIIAVTGTNGKNIKNIKTSSKDLKAKVTRLSLSSSSNSGYVGVYAKKTGKYTVSFDVYNAQNKKIKNLLSKSM